MATDSVVENANLARLPLSQTMPFEIDQETMVSRTIRRREMYTELPSTVFTRFTLADCSRFFEAKLDAARPTASADRLFNRLLEDWSLLPQDDVAPAPELAAKYAVQQALLIHAAAFKKNPPLSFDAAYVYTAAMGPVARLILSRFRLAVTWAFAASQTAMPPSQLLGILTEFFSVAEDDCADYEMLRAIEKARSMT